jgi:hypothetical protein
MGNLFRGDANTAVTNANNDPFFVRGTRLCVAGLMQGYCYLPFRGGVLNGIANEIGEAAGRLTVIALYYL